MMFILYASFNYYDEHDTYVTRLVIRGLIQTSNFATLKKHNLIR